MPTTSAPVNVTATVTGATLTVGRIRVCDGTCRDAAVSMDPATAFTIEVIITDPNGYNDINTESFSVQLYKVADINGCSPTWDCNVVNIMDFKDITLETSNGCTHAPPAGVYCISIPTVTWTTKFLNGDANIFISADDNFSGTVRFYDQNSLPNTGIWTINQTTGISEDTTTGIYSGAPSTTDNTFLSNQTGFAYVDTNHNGNTDLTITIRAIDLNISATVFIGDDNQSWHLTNSAGSSTAFTGAADTVLSDWNRGIVATSDRNSQVVYTWLDIPDQQAVGDYTGTMTYNSSAS